VLVVASGRTNRDAVSAAMRETPGLEDKIVGAVLNKAIEEFERYYRDPDLDAAYVTRAR
jgi:hypothetical protein